MADGTAPTGNQLVSFFLDTAKKQKKATEVGVEVLPIQASTAFAVQGPTLAGIVYVRHPLRANELIAFANYDERLAQERYEEALRVFTSLGAARIVATTHRQTTKHVETKLGPKDGGLLFFRRSRNSSWSLAFDQEGEGGRPIDPRPLRLTDLPGLEQVCDGVLHNGWKKSRIQITTEEKLRLDGDLAAKLRGAGFKLGVSGSKLTSTEFVIEAAFTPEASKDLDALVATTDSVPGSLGRRRKLRS